ncbi:VOC family protein [Streptomyces sp. NPDC046924]|uniref:VOC family protein n=1 Tax=Streptomyces sp. NPDC046924 TaxID=3155136 RepID=UPI0033DE1ACF
MTDARGSTRRDGEAPVRHAPGAPCWVSLMVHGPDAARRFYEALFGWEFRSGPQQLGPYARALLDGREVAGIGLLPPDRHLPVAWTPYFASADVDRTAEAVRSCGGTVGVGPLDASGAGRLAICSDPSGAVFGIWQAAAHLGTAVTGVPGAPAWNELTTYEAERVAKFYASVFGHTVEPEISTDVDHVTLHLEGRPVAAVHGVGNSLLRDRGPHWTTYFTVADLDDAVDHVLHLGGQVLSQARTGPHGRTATVTDPEGARFALMQKPG